MYSFRVTMTIHYNAQTIFNSNGIEIGISHKTHRVASALPVIRKSRESVPTLCIQGMNKIVLSRRDSRSRYQGTVG